MNRRHQLDGFVLGGTRGELFVVHEPRWWQVWRWWRWWRSPTRGTIELAQLGGRDLIKTTLRVLPYDRTLPRVPSASATEVNE